MKVIDECSNTIGGSSDYFGLQNTLLSCAMALSSNMKLVYGNIDNSPESVITFDDCYAGIDCGQINTDDESPKIDSNAQIDCSASPSGSAQPLQTPYTVYPPFKGHIIFSSTHSYGSPDHSGDIQQGPFVVGVYVCESGDAEDMKSAYIGSVKFN